MDRKQIEYILHLVREHSKKRNFSQSVDLVMNLKDFDIKNADENINTFLSLPNRCGKESKLGAFVGKELIVKARGIVDTVIMQEEFQHYQQNIKILKKLAKNIDFFIAQANLMPDIAKYFGKVLGPMGKMPNPKTGAVVPPTIVDLKPIVDKLRNTVKLQTKNEPTIKCSVGLESMKDEDLAENISAVYSTVVHSINDERQNIKNIIVKLSMGRPFIVGKTYTEKDFKEKMNTKKIKQEKKSEGL